MNIGDFVSLPQLGLVGRIAGFSDNPNDLMNVFVIWFNGEEFWCSEDILQGMHQ